MAPSIDFVDFFCKTHYSFLEGASSPEELFSTAAALGYSGLGIADLNGLYGVARAHIASKTHQLPLYIGTEINWKNIPLSLFALNRNGYGNLCELLSYFQQSLPWELENFSSDLIAVLPPIPQLPLDELRALFPKRLFFVFSFHQAGTDHQRLKTAEDLISKTHLPCLASNAPLYHVPERKVLQDVLTTIRHNTSLSEAGLHLLPNAERYLKSPHQLSQLFSKYPNWVRNTYELAQRFSFSLDEIKYQYPTEWLPESHTSQSYLRFLVFQGAKQRFGSSLPTQVNQQIEHELLLIEELSYADYFLTIWDIIQFAKSQSILFQGRGSAANSVVCYVLGITAIDPIRMELLFERFISKERHEPPDIDIDFEHERREEVIQYIYHRYGRHRAALTAEVICFRKRSALRSAGKAFGFSEREITAFQIISKKRSWQDLSPSEFSAIQEQTKEDILNKYLTVSQELCGVPRHLGTHVGGFVLSQDKLNRMIPIETAGSEDRTIVQWDKNDLDNLNFTRVDILGLGILTALKKCMEYVKAVYKKELSLDTIPAEDPKVYDSICAKDTLGLFQIESRAQMNMLPRLKPRSFFDLVVQIAIVRPGPIQGEMVHPYLKRRQGLEKVEYPHPELEAILKKTYGVPLFQEQIMKMAMTVAGFTGGEADELRRAMGTWRRDGKHRLSQMGEKFRQGLIKKGISAEFADRIFSQIEGFAEYGFPESHAASFALLTYASAYLKYYYPDAYVTALLNSQPMGFYQSHTLLYDAARHGAVLLPIDINFSDWDNQLIAPKTIRLGFREISGLNKSVSHAVIQLRKERAFFSFDDFINRLKVHFSEKSLSKRELFFLAAANAFQSIHLSRREAFWKIQQLQLSDTLSLTFSEKAGVLPQESEKEKVFLDFESFGVSLGSHPMKTFKNEKHQFGFLTTQQLSHCSHHQRVKHAGMVVSRQMPPTANGVLFMTLEDEYGLSNLIFWNATAQKYKELIWSHTFLLVEGTIQKDKKSKVIHLIVDSVTSL